MREILFKGFHKDHTGSDAIAIDGKKIKGKWFYWDKYGKILPEYVGWNEFIAGVSIIPETVCEYTGLQDSNGNRVFEGDRIKAYEADEENEYAIVYKGSDDYPAFDCKPYIECESNGLSWLKGADYKFEVIGTIFDVKEE